MDFKIFPKVGTSTSKVYLNFERYPGRQSIWTKLQLQPSTCKLNNEKNLSNLSLVFVAKGNDYLLNKYLLQLQQY